MPKDEEDEMISVWLYDGPPVRIYRKWLDEDRLRRDCVPCNKQIWLKALPLILDGRGLSPLDPVFD